MACWIGLVAGWFVSVYMVYALPNIPVEELLKPLPVVIWHGLGDSAYSPFLLGMKDDVQKMYPGIYVHLVAIEPSLFADQRATIFGNVNCQINKVHRQLSQIPELQYGFDAVGFSQGGQFLRGYVERFNSPRVRNLITFGSQHMGITNLHTCAPMDAICHTVHGILMGGVYTDYAQNSVVTAQYFRDTRTKQQFDLYQHNNHFLHDINNEGIDRNATYKANLQRLDKFVMIQFTEESTVIPAASSWFEACVDPDHREGFTDRIVPLRSTDLYQEDWIGLRALDRKRRLDIPKMRGAPYEYRFRVFRKDIWSICWSSTDYTTLDVELDEPCAKSIEHDHIYDTTEWIASVCPMCRFSPPENLQENRCDST